MDLDIFSAEAFLRAHYDGPISGAAQLLTSGLLRAGVRSEHEIWARCATQAIDRATRALNGGKPLFYNEIAWADHCLSMLNACKLLASGAKPAALRQMEAINAPA